MFYFRSNIVLLMNRNDLSLRGLSREAGISRTSIRNILKLEDFSNVTLGSAIKLSEYFDISLDDLLYRDLGKD